MEQNIHDEVTDKLIEIDEKAKPIEDKAADKLANFASWIVLIVGGVLIFTISVAFIIFLVVLVRMFISK